MQATRDQKFLWFLRMPGSGLFGVILTAFLIGCSDKAPVSEPTPASEVPKPVKSSSPVLKLRAGDNMKFNKTLLVVEAGAKVSIELTNTGRMSIEKMGHNVVVLKIGTDPFDVAMAGAVAKDSGHIPSRYKEQILAYTALAGPGKTVSVDFTAPETPGDYPFLCTFPGHLQGGMQGILRVTAPAQ